MKAHENQKISDNVRNEIMPAIIAMLPYLIRLIIKAFFPKIEKIIYEKQVKTTQEILDLRDNYGKAIT